ncbi:hypothetical protein BdWA1_001519 [Babesia duncani]|uniref:Uncharacterized protein n=1 Tax=Babesia duncani TaxID=323732 RepID=A0AAD9PKS7_9APIC|nr:hypothetical protein BdWA1_001519 [Babesia duncani]
MDKFPPSIISPNFNSEEVLDSIIRRYNDEHDVFYFSLLNDLKDEELKRVVENIRSSKLGLGRPSHAVFLLPWAVQSMLYSSEFYEESNIKTVKQSKNPNRNIKKSLQSVVDRAKAEAELSELLLHLRLTGFSHSKDMCYKFLKEQHALGNKITVVCNSMKHGGESVHYTGEIVMFDTGCNLLLNKVTTRNNKRLPFIFISCSIIQAFKSD